MDLLAWFLHASLLLPVTQEPSPVAADPTQPAPQGSDLVASQAPETASTELPESVLSLLEGIDAAFDESDLELARGILQETVANLDQLGLEVDEVAVQALLALDRRAQQLGLLTDQRDLRASILDLRLRLLPPEHLLVHSARYDLALTAGELGDHAGALVLAKEVLEARAGQLPPEHPLVLAAKRTVADTLYALGDLPGAKELYEEILKTSSQSSESDRPGLVRPMSNLALAKKALGDLEGARALEEAVLEIWARLAPEHPDFLRAKQNLATTKRELGDLAGAHELFEEVLVAWTRLLRPEHQDLLAAKQNLALTRRELGDLAGARVLQESVLEARGRLLPPGHPDLVAAKRNLALTLKAQDDLPGARVLLQGALESLARHLPPAHPDVLQLRQDLVEVLVELGDDPGARELLEQSVRLLEASSETLHPQLQADRLLLARLLLQTGDIAAGVGLLETIVDELSRSLPLDHPELQEALRDLWSALRVQRNLSRALEIERMIRLANPYPPHLQVQAPEGPHATLEERRFVLKAWATDYASIRNIRVIVDGLELQYDRTKCIEVDETGREAKLQLELEIPRDRPEITLQLQAINASGAASELQTLIVRYQPPLQELYLLAVGVGDYEDDELDLRFPAQDVRDLVAFFETQQSTFFRTVHVRTLIDAQASAGKVRELKHEFLARARPEDTIVVFLAGHGVRAETGEYFFLTPEATADKPYAGLERAQVDSLVVWERLRARRRVLLLDTCNAGRSAPGSARGTQRGVVPWYDGPSPVEPAADSTRHGVYVLAASTDFGFAREQEGNGLFTRTVLDGLVGAADADGDGLVEIEELRGYTEDEVESRSGGNQLSTMPTVMGGENFALARVPRR